MEKEQLNILKNLVYFIFLIKIADYEKNDYLKKDAQLKIETELLKADKESIPINIQNRVLVYSQNLKRQNFIDTYFQNIVEQALDR
ncbi:MAG: hypothetical protein JW924_00635 [Fusobacteriaceae bacterium]|nr:hypothetical protein [Fusobacteriaceae bacterium]